MKKKERVLSKHLTPEEIDTWKRYHKRGCSKFVKCKIDQVNLDMNTTRGHKIAIMKRSLEALENNEHFITESESNKLSRRVDFVSLTKDQEEEFETNTKVKKQGALTKYVDKETGEEL